MTITTQFPAATELDRLCVDTIRMLSIDAVQKANSGHPGTPMALAPIGYVLFTRVMRHSPEHPDWPDRDRFVLSAGHWLALGERMLNSRFGDEVIDHYTVCIASDGDLREGLSSEASSLGGHVELGLLIVSYDDNHVSIEGPTSLAFSEDVGARYEAYGWRVQHLSDGFTLDQVERAASAAIHAEDRPSLIICRTHIAPGAPHKQDTAEAHGAPLGEEEVRLTKRVWHEDEPFYVPAEALEHFRSCIERGRELHGEPRQGVPTWNPAAVPPDAIERGAYVLRHSYREPEPPELILIATGSEVHICARAADVLEAEGIATRVVSVPRTENFAAQDRSYRDRVLPTGMRARVSLEAASTGDWNRWVGDLGKAIGMQGSGASGPAGALYKHFGLRPERVALAGRRSVRRAREKAHVG